ncbi:MAG: TraB/GumN family protein [Bacteroidales bacterium]|nr:TraB/GumN family protein [Bacteroidales bacterium]
MTLKLEKHSCLIAVGTLHLPGEEGLINLLRKEGFSLRLLNLYER